MKRCRPSKLCKRGAGIAVDGIYGPATEKALAAIEAKKKKPSSSGKKYPTRYRLASIR